MAEKFQEEDPQPEPEFQTAFPAPNAKVKKPAGFQTAFPEDTEDVPTEPLCQYGCGQPGKFFGSGPRGGELPRCAGKMSDCPAVKNAATRSAKADGRLGRRWRSRF